MCHNLWVERQVSNQKSWIKQDLPKSKSTAITSLWVILTSMRQGFSKRADIGSVYNVPWRSSFLHFKHGRVFNLHAPSFIPKAFYRIQRLRKKKRVRICIHAVLWCSDRSFLSSWYEEGVKDRRINETLLSACDESGLVFYLNSAKFKIMKKVF